MHTTAAALGMHMEELCRLLGWFEEAICGPPRRRSAGAAACLLSSVRAVEAVSRASLVVGGTSLIAGFRRGARTREGVANGGHF